MIRHIRVLKAALANKELYIWDVGKHAIWLFYSAAMRCINISGFVTNYPQYVGDTILNRPIISPEEFTKKPNAVLLVSERVTKGTFDLAKSYGHECYLWPDALDRIRLCGRLRSSFMVLIMIPGNLLKKPKAKE